MVAYTSLSEILTNILETHHSFYFPSVEGGGGGGVNAFQPFGRGLEGGGVRVFSDSNYKFYFTTLI